jgi:hypothetical protein
LPLHKSFHIETIEDDPGKFKAVIRKADGNTLRTAAPPGGPDAQAITTQLYPSAENALAAAMEVIDAGGVV